MALRCSTLRPLRLTAPRLGGAFIKRHVQSGAGESSVGKIVTKARSTAEEFTRLASEKAEPASEKVKESWEKPKEAVAAITKLSNSAGCKEKVDQGK